MTNKFNVGDRVICVTKSIDLEFGKEYQVIMCDNTYITVKDFPYSAYIHQRFKPALYRKEKINKLKEIINGCR